MPRIIELRSCAARLREALDQLDVAWSHTTEKWNDAACHRFEQEHLQPIGPQLRATLDAINHIDQILQHADRECS